MLRFFISLIHSFTLLLVCSLVFPFETQAAEPTTKPQFRIQGEMHNALVRVIRQDVVHNRMVTVSHDKTIRIWQLPQWRLVKVIYVPSEIGYEGQLNALAVSPDGNTIAVAGWTGWDWDKSVMVYLFNSETGDIKQVIKGLKSVVSYMAFSPDGGLLAVGLTDQQGLHLFESKNYNQVYEDMEYGGEVSFVEFSPKDRTLVTSSNDGYVRLYDPNQKLSIRQPLGISKHIGGIRISPDGKMVSFGLQDKPLALVLTIPQMQVIGKLTAEDISGQESLCCIAWSSDGKYVFANGRFEGKGKTSIYRWDVPNFKNRKVIPASEQRVQSMFPLKDGSIVYATEDPSIGQITTQGESITLVEPVIANFKNGGETLKVSEDGLDISFPMGSNGQWQTYFSVNRLAYDQIQSTLKGSDSKHVAMSSANRSSQNFHLKNFENSESPELNGKLIKAYPQEIFRSYAVTADDKALLIGTDWSLRLLDTNGEAIWDIRGQGVAWNVNITKNGQYAVATYGDGIIRWHKMSDGQVVLSLFPHRNGQDWVLWRPDGYYASSENGDKYVGWLINRGKEKTPDFYRAIQFERVFYRPDLVKTVLNSTKSLNSSVKQQPTSADFTIERISEILPPRITIQKIEANREANNNWLDLTVKFESEKLSTNEFGVYVNGIPLLRNEERKFDNNSDGSVLKTIKVPITEKDNEIRIEAFDGVSMGLAETFVNSTYTATNETRKKGNLYVLAIGANHFTNFSKDDNVDLDYAAQDAEELAKLIQLKSNQIYENVSLKVLSDFSDMKATKDNIKSSLDFLKQAQFNDTVVLFLASHGFSDAVGNYYFLPRDANKKEVKSILSPQKSDALSTTSLVSWKDFFEALSKSAGRRIMIVDTCQAKGVSGTFDSHTLKKRSAAAQFALMVASQADESSQEFPPAQHGLFTFSLLEGLKGKADDDKNGQVTMEELYQFSTYLVDKLRSEKQPQKPDLIAPIVLRETLLAVKDQGDVKNEKVSNISKTNVSMKNNCNKVKSRTLSFSGGCN